jgi:hypothetical protein
LSESEEEIGVLKVVFIDDMVNVVRVDEQLAQLHGMVTRLRLPTRNEPINKLRCCMCNNNNNYY